ncbi:MAG: isochorismate synthase [Coleofasciculaceae cyanobacterium SM2_1_6]|nr:isochorismate synthase [Coleofasciculaceae cyanobacterium SM2_1_6]
MSVIPCSVNLFQDRQHLTKALLGSQQKSREIGGQHFVSISQSVTAVDPLQVLALFATPEQHYFYLENPMKGQSIAAFGCVISNQTYQQTYQQTNKKHNSLDRFQESQEFIQFCQQNTTYIGDIGDIENSISNNSIDKSIQKKNGMIFLCGFSFFAEQESASHPFNAANIFLPQWQIHRQFNQCFLVANLAITTLSNIDKIVDRLIQEFHEITGCFAPKYHYYSPQKSLDQPLDRTLAISANPNLVITPSHQQNHQFQTAKQNIQNHQFQLAVQNALTSIAQKKFQKIVLAQTREIMAIQPFSVINTLRNLRHKYPDCYTFALSNGAGYTFLGASPERLLSINHRSLVTDALAGSAPRYQDLDQDQQSATELLANKKERNEHQTVVDFLDRTLIDLGLQTQKSATPKILKLSNIQHLWTPITAQLHHLHQPIHPLEILKKLHPTPAVAGTPREIVSTEIQRYEQFNRGLYAAPIGWVDAWGNSEFIVGIRSCLIHGYHAQLYAGAGIVAGSDPEKELAEIELKFQPLLNALA